MERMITQGGVGELKVDSHGGITLCLNDKRPRHIGRIKKNRKGVLVYQKYEDSVFEKFGAFGFCYDIIQKLNPEVIRVDWTGGNRVERGTYRIGRDKLLKVAKYLDFKKKGLELRCYIPVEEFHYRAEK